MLRPSFVPPRQIRVLRDYTRLRADLTRDRTRHWQRLEKLLEDALIKVSAVASNMTTLSVRDMVEALIAGERTPRVLAGLARGRMRAKHAALVEALDRPVRRPPRRTGPDPARPDRRAHRPDRPAHRPHRTTHRRAAHAASHRQPSDHRPPAAPTTQPHRRSPTARPSTSAVRTPRRDPRHRPRRRPGHPGRGRPGHDPVPHRRGTGVLGQTVPPHHPVRRQTPHPAGPAKATPTSKASSASAAAAAATHPHLPRRTLPAHRQTPRQTQEPSSPSPAPSSSSSGTCSPTPPPASTTSAPDYHTNRIDKRPQDPQPRPPTRSPRLHRHPHPSRIMRRRCATRRSHAGSTSTHTTSRPTRGIPARSDGAKRTTARRGTGGAPEEPARRASRSERR